MISSSAAGPAAERSILDEFTVTEQTEIADLSIRHNKHQTVLGGGEFALWLQSPRNCFEKIEYLSLTGQEGVRPEEFADIAGQMPNLKVIDLVGTRVPPSAVLMLLRKGLPPPPEGGGPPPKIPALEKIHVAYNTWDQTLAADEIACVAVMMLYRAERLVINESMPDLKEIELPDLSL